MPRDPKTEALNLLRANLDELRAKAYDARKTNDRLRSEAENKIQAIKKIEIEVKEEDELFQKKRDDILKKRKEKQYDYHIRINALKIEHQACLEELSRLDISQQEHDRLDAKLKAIAYEYYQEDMKMNEKIEDRRRKAFDMKMNMDLVFRKTLASLEDEYKLRANEIIEEEAVEAEATLTTLERSTGQREKECYDIINRQRESYDKLMKVKVDMDVLTTTHHMQEQMSYKVEAANRSIQEELDIMLDRCDRIVYESRDVQEKLVVKNSAIDDLEKAKAENVELVDAIHKSSSQVKKFCEEILREAIISSDKQKAASFNHLCEKFTDIIDMNVGRKAGSVLLVEKKHEEEDVHVDISKPEDDYDYDAIWRSDDSNSRLPSLLRRVTASNRIRSDMRTAKTPSSRMARKPYSSASERLSTAQQRFQPPSNSKSFSMMS